MNKWILFLISLILLVIDNSLMPFLAIKGIFPSILFIFAIAYSIINGKKEAVIVGVMSGLLQDIYFYEGLGMNALSNMLICLLAAFIGENIYKEKRIVPTFSMFFLGVVKVLFLYLILKLSNKTLNIELGIYEAIYSSAIMFIGYNFVLRLCDIKYKNKSWRFR